MAFEVAAGETAPAVILILNVEYDLCACRLGLPVDDVGVRDDHVSGLCFSAADLAGLLHKSPERRIGHRCEHDHSISEAELGVGDRAILVGRDELLFKAEDAAEPFDRCRRIAITKTWNHCRFCIFWNFWHDFLPSAQGALILAACARRRLNESLRR